MSDEQDQVIVVPRSDPVFSVFVWRQDSITLARLRPILNRLRDTPNQPCRLYTNGSCILARPALQDEWCITCQIRSIKIELFGDPSTNHKEEVL